MKPHLLEFVPASWSRAVLGAFAAVLVLLAIWGIGLKSAHAQEEPPTPILTVEVTIVGEGTVTSNPEGIYCTAPESDEGSCEADFGDDVALTAYPAEGYEFSHWEGDCSSDGDVCNISYNSESDSTASVTAYFTSVQECEPSDESEQLACISGLKFNDRNRNGAQDSRDKGLGGWTIYLYSYSYEGESENPVLTLVSSTETDEEGLYVFNFNSLELGEGEYYGEYAVCEELRSGWIQSAPRSNNEGDEFQVIECDNGTNGYLVYIDSETPSSYYSGLDFGNYRRGSGSSSTGSGSNTPPSDPPSIPFPTDYVPTAPGTPGGNGSTDGSGGGTRTDDTGATGGTEQQGQILGTSTDEPSLAQADQNQGQDEQAQGDENANQDSEEATTEKGFGTWWLWLLILLIIIILLYIYWRNRNEGDGGTPPAV